MIDVKDSHSIKENISPFHFVYLLSGPEKAVKACRKKKKKKAHEAGSEKESRELRGGGFNLWM